MFVAYSWCYRELNLAAKLCAATKPKKTSWTDLVRKGLGFVAGPNVYSRAEKGPLPHPAKKKYSEKPRQWHLVCFCPSMRC